MAALNFRHREVAKATVAIQKSGEDTLRVGLPRLLHRLAMTRQEERKLAMTKVVCCELTMTVWEIATLTAWVRNDEAGRM